MFSISQLTDVYYNEIKMELSSLPPLVIIGIMSNEADAATLSYAKTLQVACDRVGISLQLSSLPPSNIDEAIIESNFDPSISGIFVFYPIRGEEQDAITRMRVLPSKDVEGLAQYWSNKLIMNDRVVNDHQGKAVLPCTALAVLKTLISACSLTESPNRTFVGETITIFNRSKVVGHPLAWMLRNDGAVVFTFDVHGGYALPNSSYAITRAVALEKSSIVVTGVPSPTFDRIKESEISNDTVCLNFSFVENFTPEAIKKAHCYIPRVGPMTIAMCLRNAVRLHRHAISCRHP